MSSCVNNPAVVEQFPEALQWSIVAWIVLAGSIGFICNVVSIIAILRTPDLQQKGSTKLTLNLFMSSAMNCCSFMLFVIATFVDGPLPDDKKLSSNTWKMLLSTGFLLTAVHMYSTATLSVTRLIAMVKPLLYRRMMSPYPVTALLAFIWGLSAFQSLPAYLGVFGIADPQTLDFNGECGSFSLAKTANIFFLLVICGITPFIMYIIMFVQVFQARKAVQTSPSSGQIEKKITQWQSGITHALFVTVMVHTIFWVPHQAYHIMTVFYSNAYASAIIHSLLIIQFVMDPLIFMVFAQNYRNAGLNLLRYLFRREMDNNIGISNSQVSSSLGNKV